MLPKHLESFTVTVIVGKPKTKLISYDDDSNTAILDVNAKPIHGEANEKIVAFFTKYFEKPVKIIGAKKTTKKIIKVLI